MTTKTFDLITSDNKKHVAYRWNPENSEPKAVIQYIHGMMDHADRFKEMAQRLTTLGLVVYATDLRGHGKSVSSAEQLGHWGPEISLDRIVKDQQALTESIKAEYPDLPIIVYGHSMGSFLAQAYAIKHSDTISGLILSGSTWKGGAKPPWRLYLGLTVATLLCAIGKKAHQAHFLHKEVFGKFNSGFENVKSQYDWLTRDKSLIKEYQEDPTAGIKPTNHFFKLLFKLAAYISNPRSINEIRRDLPVLFISGTEDPLGRAAFYVKKQVAIYEKLQFKNVTLKLYKEARHELHREINIEEVFKDIAEWYQSIIANSLTDPS